MIKPHKQHKYPEIAFNTELLSILKSLEEILAGKSLNCLKVTPQGISLINGQTRLVEITPQDILVAGQSFESKLVDPNDLVNEPSPSDQLVEQFTLFLTQVADHIVRLNHLGLCYPAPDLDAEQKALKTLSDSQNIPPFRENSHTSRTKWLFMGDTADWQQPLFEIVLNQTSIDQTPEYLPHFQIDLDTTLTIEEIKQLTDTHIRPGFVSWQLDIPNYGIVLAMGLLGKVGNTEIVLGLGTDKRGTEFHRKKVLKPV